MMQRSISMPVKPPYVEEYPNLERSKEWEVLFREEDEFSSENSESYLDDDDLSHCDDNDSTTTGDNDKGSISDNELLIVKQEKHEWVWKNESTELNSKMLECQFNCAVKRWSKNDRIIDKKGHQNVKISRIPNHALRYCRDFFNTLIEQDWKYTFTLFLLSYAFSWIFFTVVWYIIVTAHGDFLFDEKTGARLGEGKGPCVIGVKDLLGLFIYTVELQTTVGFGQKIPSEECPEGSFLFVFQIIISIAIEGAMISIIYAKIAKPVKQVSKQKFSKNAVIYRRDGNLCFCFRVCDPNEQQSIDTKIYINIVEERQTSEGEVLKINNELKIDGINSPILVWPATVCHVVDESSPLHKYITTDFEEKENFEIIVSLVGGSPNTGQITESRTSYLPYEILWNRKFPNIIHYDWSRDAYFIDFRHFSRTISANKHRVKGVKKS